MTCFCGCWAYAFSRALGVIRSACNALEGRDGGISALVVELDFQIKNRHLSPHRMIPLILKAKFC
jgi:hypothetical protein